MPCLHIPSICLSHINTIRAARRSFTSVTLRLTRCATREDKDRTHLRNLPETDRVVALAGLAKRLDLSRDENLGAVLHLYTDILWDTSQLKRYIQSYGEGVVSALQAADRHRGRMDVSQPARNPPSLGACSWRSRKQSCRRRMQNYMRAYLGGLQNRLRRRMWQCAGNDSV